MKQRLKGTFISILVPCFFIANISLASSYPLLRNDLKKTFSKVICNSSPQKINETLRITTINDAQIEAQTFKRKNGKRADIKKIAKRARSFAIRNNHNGYIYSVCKKSGLGWVVSTPSPRAIVLKNKSFTLPQKDLRKICKSYSVDFVKNTSGKRQHFDQTSSKFHFSSSINGVVSVTCQPKRPSWQGPILWSLISVGKGPLKNPPSFSRYENSPNELLTLASWVNKIRKKEGLGPLKVNPKPLKDSASVLGIGQSITHNRSLLTNEKTKMAQNNFVFLGENRVKGTSVKEMAWLLWNSPMHRDLLLNQDASYIGIDFHRSGSEYFSVLIFARKTTKPIASKGTKGSKKL